MNLTKADLSGGAVICGSDAWHPREAYPVTSVRSHDNLEELEPWDRFGGD